MAGLFFSLAVVASFFFGFTMCLHWLSTDNVIHDRISKAYYFENLYEWTQKCPTDTPVWAALATLLFVVAGIWCL